MTCAERLERKVLVGWEMGRGEGLPECLTILTTLGI